MLNQIKNLNVTRERKVMIIQNIIKEQKAQISKFQTINMHDIDRNLALAFVNKHLMECQNLLNTI